jgi:hypothetical protein
LTAPTGEDLVALGVEPCGLAVDADRLVARVIVEEVA